jgi:hypothetical protein
LTVLGIDVDEVNRWREAIERRINGIEQEAIRHGWYWVRRLVPVFSAVEREALRPGYRYSMAQMELATDVVFKRSAPLRALFQRACELGVLVGGANRTTHLFGRRINRHYRGKLQTCAGPARRRTSGAALVLPDVLRQAVRPR